MQEQERKPAESKPTTFHEKTKDNFEDISKPQVEKRGGVVIYSENEEANGSVPTSSSEDESDFNHKSNDQTPPAETIATATPSPKIDSSSRKTDVDKSEASTTDSDAASISDAATETDEESISRSPARHRSKTRSSVSGSDLASEESIESDSNSDMSTTAASSSPTMKSKIQSQGLSVSPERGVDLPSNKVGNESDVTAYMPIKDAPGATLSAHHSSMHYQWPMTPPGTNSADSEAMNAQLQPEHRASISPVQSPKTATDISSIPSATAPRNADSVLQAKNLNIKDSKPEKFRYPKLSEMMQVAKESPARSTLGRSSVGKLPKQAGHDEYEDEELSSDVDESSNSDDEAPGTSVLKGLRKRMNKFSCLPDDDGVELTSKPVATIGRQKSSQTQKLGRSLAE